MCRMYHYQASITIFILSTTKKPLKTWWKWMIATRMRNKSNKTVRSLCYRRCSKCAGFIMPPTKHIFSKNIIINWHLHCDWYIFSSKLRSLFAKCNNASNSKYFWRSSIFLRALLLTQCACVCVCVSLLRGQFAIIQIIYGVLCKQHTATDIVALSYEIYYFIFVCHLLLYCSVYYYFFFGDCCE